MSTEPDWSTAPRDATHWGPANDDYSAAWYKPNPKAKPDDFNRWLCINAIAALSEKDPSCDCESHRPADQLIPRPTPVTENDVDTWL